jgi:tRNA U34 5-methylaminomethyl-2-thiouridine-forming methyltransferase MnmC
VYIKAGLDYIAKVAPADIRIFEMGFGTGLNALLTQIWADTHQRMVRYTSIEAYPLGPEVWQQLNYGTQLQRPDAFHQLHTSAWQQPIMLSENFQLAKWQSDLVSFETSQRFDLIYFDAFAPDKQPHLWTIPIFEKLHALLRPGGTVVTYCAKGQVKRNFRAAGFLVEALPGPPGKREMIRCSV